jgi:carbamate kinase
MCSTPAVSSGGTLLEHPLTQVTVEELRKMSFAPGSMAPKVDAAHIEAVRPHSGKYAVPSSTS